MGEEQALVVLSGGQDSTTCLYIAISKHGVNNVHAITFDYGQRHDREIESAMRIAKMAGVKHEILKVGNILQGTSPLTDHDIQVELYKDAESLPGGLEKTFVPSRNMLFLTIASNRAYVLGCSYVYTGVSQEDFGGYPDCRIEFIKAMENAYVTGLDRDIKIVTPLITKNKKQTVQIAMGYEGCMEAMAYSHTCYNGHFPPCGKCHACLLRAKGFVEADVIDPLMKRVVNIEAEMAELTHNINVADEDLPDSVLDIDLEENDGDQERRNFKIDQSNEDYNKAEQEDREDLNEENDGEQEIDPSEANKNKPWSERDDSEL